MLLLQYAIEEDREWLKQAPIRMVQALSARITANAANTEPPLKREPLIPELQKEKEHLESRSSAPQMTAPLSKMQFDKYPTLRSVDDNPQQTFGLSSVSYGIGDLSMPSIHSTAPILISQRQELISSASQSSNLQFQHLAGLASSSPPHPLPDRLLVLNTEDLVSHGQSSIVRNQAYFLNELVDQRSDTDKDTVNLVWCVCPLDLPLLGNSRIVYISQIMQQVYFLWPKHSPTSALRPCFTGVLLHMLSVRLVTQLKPRSLVN